MLYIMDNINVTFIAPYLVLSLLYFIAVVVYRLYFSPVARFPGPKLTAVTGWVETYYDVFKGGQFTFQLQKWHEHYGVSQSAYQPWCLYTNITLSNSSPLGPIIRINPYEIHISDPEFYDVAYASSAPFDKMPKWLDRFGLPGAVQSTVQHELHRSRRMTLNPHFSKKSIGTVTWLIQQRMDQLCDRLLREYKITGEVVTLNDAWGALTADIIINYCFGWDYNFV